MASDGRGPPLQRQLEDVAARRRAGDARAAAERRIVTTFIGAVAAVEKHFGTLWGHGSDAEKTPQQRAWAVVWGRCREEIMDKGNAQVRAHREEER